jgi:small conductance mechanosensitive channel
MQSRNRVFLTLCTALFLLWAGVAFAENEDDARATDPAWNIPVEVLRLQIKYLSADELIREADRWQAILRSTVQQLNQANIDIWYENQKLADAEAAASGSTSAGQESADRNVEQETGRKDKVLARLAELREQRVQVIDRLHVVLDELSAKLGETAEGEEQETVQNYRRYVNAVKALKLDVADTQSTRATIVSWLKSSEGGLRLLNHLGKFLAIVAGFWLLSIVLSKLVSKALALSSNVSHLLRKFVIDAVRRITFIVGLMLGLAALEINVTPLVAVIGAAGFVIAFALQDTLSNFASGLMIMFYKPFDIGDFIETSQIAGKVRSMTLVTTNVMTADNKLMVVPNNELWGKVITNVTGSSERRVDLVFGIGYNDDIGLAERVLAEVVAAHPLVLKEPEPVIRVAELADSSVNLICRPWVRTPDYWAVYWDLTRAVKERFDAEGVSIPFPQRDVHLHPAADPVGE